MNALALPDTASAAHIEPGFEAVLALVSDAYAIPKGELRTRTGDAAEGARDCFLWLCDHLKTRGTFAAAAFVGVAQADALASIANVDRQRATDPAVRTHTDELALTLYCEAAVMDRLTLHRSEDPSPEDTARRILSSRRNAGLVGIEQLQALAAAYAQMRLSDETDRLRAELELLRAECGTLQADLASAKAQMRRVPVSGTHVLDRPLQDFVTASAALERVSSHGERAARLNFEKACAVLAAASESHFNITRTFK